MNLLLNKNFLIAAGAALALIAAVAAFNWWLSGVKAEARHDGQITERAEWLARESKELAAADRAIQFLNDAYRKLERKSAQDVADAAITHKKEVNRVEAEKHRALASAESFRLRWTTSCTASQGPSGNPTAGAGTSAGTAIGTAECQLPEPTRSDLIREASRADQVVAEYNVLLQIAKKDREVCR